MPRRSATNSATNGRKWVIVLGSLVFGTLFVSQALWVVTFLLLGTNPFGKFFLTFGLIGAGLITFFGFIWNGLGADGELALGEMRTALTASIVIVYLGMVTLFAFFSGNIPVPETTKTLLSSFTSLVAIVVPFYFGASVASDYIQAKDREQEAATRRRQTGGDERTKG
jgi:hypothetical protein